LLSLVLEVPFLASEQLERIQALCCDSGVQALEFSGNPGVEVPDDVGQFARDCISSLDLGLGWPSLIADNVAVQVAQILAQSLLACYHTAFFGCNDSLAEVVDLGRSRL